MLVNLLTTTALVVVSLATLSLTAPVFTNEEALPFLDNEHSKSLINDPLNDRFVLT